MEKEKRIFLYSEKMNLNGKPEATTLRKRYENAFKKKGKMEKQKQLESRLKIK